MEQRHCFFSRSMKYIHPNLVSICLTGLADGLLVHPSLATRGNSNVDESSGVLQSLLSSALGDLLLLLGLDLRGLSFF